MFLGTLHSTKEKKMQKRVYLLCVFLMATGFALTGCGQSVQKSEGKSAKPVKTYAAKDFSGLLGMEGFTDVLLQNHFKLYQGYVKNTNLLLDQLKALLKSGDVSSAEYSELKRRLGFEFNGMVLHELYFSNLGGTEAPDVNLPLHDAIVQNFGSFDRWKKDFVATGAMRGIGWVVLYEDPQSGHLINFWINDHEANHPAGCKPLLVMDVWEHAYMLDYQLDRGKYVEAFFNNINWDEVAARYDRTVAPAAVPAKPESDGAPTGEPPKMIEKQHQS